MARMLIIYDGKMEALALMDEGELHPEGNVFPIMYPCPEDEMMLLRSQKWIDSQELVEEVDYNEETDHKSLYKNIMKDRPKRQKKMYLCINGEISYIDHWADVIEAWESVFPEHNQFLVGYHNYSLEFTFDGIFLYPIDRNDRESEAGDFHFSSLEILHDLMADHGKMYKDFIKEIAGHVPISNFNNNDDFYVYELREYILPKPKILTLYPEDFEKDYDWNAVCDQLQISNMSASVDVTFIGVESNDKPQ